MNRHASFRIVKDTDKLLCIEDIGDHSKQLTITNDAEHVVEVLAERVGDRRLEYYDSQGDVCQLVIKDGKFGGFSE